jgi:hypothetical protein
MKLVHFSKQSEAALVLNKLSTPPHNELFGFCITSTTSPFGHSWISEALGWVDGNSDD